MYLERKAKLPQVVTFSQLVIGAAECDLSDVGVFCISIEHIRHEAAEVSATVEVGAGGIK